MQQCKPNWLKVRIPASANIFQTTDLLRANQHVTVCEQAACPNLTECFHKGTATFMLMGDYCTRCCKFCNIKHGSPKPIDLHEPAKLAITIKKMQLKYAVLTSVSRDDIPDGGASHFANCIKEIYAIDNNVKIEILTPDFCSAQLAAIKTLMGVDYYIFNHNIETVARLYNVISPKADYQRSLELLKTHKQMRPNILTKSGLMVGLGETNAEIIEIMYNLRECNVDMLTIGQYMQPTSMHWPVSRYVAPDDFKMFTHVAKKMGFKNAFCGPLVRSSYHADRQDIIAVL